MSAQLTSEAAAQICDVISDRAMEGSSTSEAMRMAGDALREIETLRAQLSASEASRKELREAFKRYAWHSPVCDKSKHPAAHLECTCGFEAALANDAEQKGGGANG